ncbi:tripartite tricarboxylate transporter TctB family protein [Tissierellaceae bacterium HCP3S3_D8]
MLSLLSVFFIKESLKLHNNQSWTLSPALFPLIITSLTFLFSIALIIRGIKDKNIKQEDSIENWKRLLLVIFISIMYLIILPKLHFLLASIIYLFLFLLILGERKWWLLGALSIITPLLIQYLFGNLLDVFLP